MNEVDEILRKILVTILMLPDNQRQQVVRRILTIDWEKVKNYQLELESKRVPPPQMPPLP